MAKAATSAAETAATAAAEVVGSLATAAMLREEERGKEESWIYQLSTTQYLEKPEVEPRPVMRKKSEGNIAPPFWTEVVGRNARRNGETVQKPKSPPSVRSQIVNRLRSRAPRSVAVVIGPLKEGQKYAEVMRVTMGVVDPKFLSVEVNGIRRTCTGAVLLEVHGSADQVNKLSGMLSEVLTPLWCPC